MAGIVLGTVPIMVRRRRARVQSRRHSRPLLRRVLDSSTDEVADDDGTRALHVRACAVPHTHAPPRTPPLPHPPPQYFMAAFVPDPATAFAYLLGIFALMATYAVMGMCAAAVAPSYAVAQSALGFANSVFFLFGGMYAPISGMVPGARWVTYIDPVAYALRFLVPPQLVCAAAPCSNVTVPSEAAPSGFADVDRYAYMSALYDFYIEDRRVGVWGAGGGGRTRPHLTCAVVTPSRGRHARRPPHSLAAGGRASATCRSSSPSSSCREASR